MKKEGEIMEKVRIDTDFIKLDQFLKYAGITSTGGESKNIISDGLVKVNGQAELARGKKLRKGDTVEIMRKIYEIV